MTDHTIGLKTMTHEATKGLRLTNEEAYALAELCKRITWDDCMRLSASREEGERMIRATDAVRASLSENGYSVR